MHQRLWQMLDEVLTDLQSEYNIIIEKVPKGKMEYTAGVDEGYLIKIKKFKS